MIESVFTANLLLHLRRLLPTAVVFKHHDSTTGGIPDFSVSYKNQTFWVEVKLGDNKPTKLQRLTLRRLSLNGCPAFLLFVRNPVYFQVYEVPSVGDELREARLSCDVPWTVNTFKGLFEGDYYHANYPGGDPRRIQGSSRVHAQTEPIR